MDRTMAADWQSAIERARAHAPFLSRAMDRLPEMVALASEGLGEQMLALARQAGEGATICAWRCAANDWRLRLRSALATSPVLFRSAGCAAN